MSRHWHSGGDRQAMITWGTSTGRRLCRLFACLVVLGSVVGALAWSGEAAAHSQAPEVQPADGSVLAVPPEALNFSFPEAIRLTAVRLYDSGDREIALPGKRDMTPAKQRRIALPPLTAGSYRVEWRALSADGHPVTGRFSFTVSAGN